jgi:hypothetical protein
MGWAYSTHNRHDNANKIVFGLQNVCYKLNSDVRRLIYCVRKFGRECTLACFHFLTIESRLMRYTCHLHAHAHAHAHARVCVCVCVRVCVGGSGDNSGRANVRGASCGNSTVFRGLQGCSTSVQWVPGLFRG